MPFGHIYYIVSIDNGSSKPRKHCGNNDLFKKLLSEVLSLAYSAPAIY